MSDRSETGELHWSLYAAAIVASLLGVLTATHFLSLVGLGLVDTSIPVAIVLHAIVTIVFVTLYQFSLLRTLRWGGVSV